MKLPKTVMLAAATPLAKAAEAMLKAAALRARAGRWGDGEGVE